MSPTADPPRRRLSPGRKLLFTLILLVGFLGLLEVGFRLLKGPLGIGESGLNRVRNKVVAGRTLFPPNPHTAYRLDPADPGVNSMGFRDTEHEYAKPEGTLRIACLGGSTTHGFLVPSSADAYPAQLAELLSERLKRPVEALNFGIPSWTTIESMNNYFDNVQDFHPDVVIVQHSMNDVSPRLLPDFRNDYSHYRKVQREPSYSFLTRTLVRCSDLYAYLFWRVLRSATVDDLDGRGTVEKALVEFTPETQYPYLRNLTTIGEHVQAHGGTYVLITTPVHPDKDLQSWKYKAEGCALHNQLLRELAAEKGHVLVDLERDWAAQWDTLLKNFADPVHLDRQGNRKKARRVMEVLLAARVLPR